MSTPTKRPNIFGQVLGAILAAAAIGAIILGIWALHSQAVRTSQASAELQREIARTDILLKTPLRDPPKSQASNADTPQETYWTLKITKPVELKNSVGRVVARLEVGQSVQYVGRDNYRARIRYNGTYYEIPIASTDLK
jgi:hypothetical protein